MVTYPIHVTRDGYRGNNSGKRAKAAQTNRMASELETYINAQLLAQQSPIKQYSYHQIASATGVPYEVVRRQCFAIDGGHNGFTAVKPGMTYEQALDQQHRIIDGEP